MASFYCTYCDCQNKYNKCKEGVKRKYETNRRVRILLVKGFAVLPKLGRRLSARVERLGGLVSCKRLHLYCTIGKAVVSPGPSVATLLASCY